MTSSGSNKKKTAPQSASVKKGSEFICKIRYKNPLPEIPFGPKFLSQPIDETKLSEYKRLESEKSHLFPIFTDFHLGMPLDLVDLDGYRVSVGGNDNLDDEDRALLLEPRQQKSKADSGGIEQQQNQQRFRPLVPWLRRTEYISNDSKSRKISDETVLLKKKIEKLNGGDEMDASSATGHQKRLIERTFTLSREWEVMGFQKRHPSKADVHVVEIFPIFPDFELWRNKYAHCSFDDDPLQSLHNKSSLDPVTDDSLSGVLMKPFMTNGENSQALMTCYVPSEKDYISNQLKYDLLRSYSFTVNPQGHMEKLFISVHPEAGAFYNPINAKFSLRKRRKTENDAHLGIPGHLLVKYRQFTSEEEKSQEESVESSLGIRFDTISS